MLLKTLIVYNDLQNAKTPTMVQGDEMEQNGTIGNTVIKASTETIWSLGISIAAGALLTKEYYNHPVLTQSLE